MYSRTSIVVRLCDLKCVASQIRGSVRVVCLVGVLLIVPVFVVVVE